MSNPADRLLTDEAARRCEVEALAVLAGPMTSPSAQSLAASVIALCGDRAARIELDAVRRAA